MLLEGLFVPLTTPFYPDGTLNLRKLEHNVFRYSKTPAAGLAVLSEQGEPTLLSDDETRQALKAAIEIAAVEKVMLAGIARDSVIGAVDLVAYAATLGYDAALVTAPLFLRVGSTPRTRELLSYFRAVADRSALPLVVAGIQEVAVVLELAGHPNIIGLVDASSSAETIAKLKAGTADIKRDATVTHVFAAVTNRMLGLRDASQGSTFIAADALTGGGAALAVAPPKPAIKTRTRSVGFQIVVGTSLGMLPALRAGATGAMPPFAACAPQASYEVYAAWKDGDEPLAEEKQGRIEAAAQKIEVELGTPGIRYASDLNGYFGGRPRLPKLPVDGQERAEIDTLLQVIRN